MTTSKTPVDYTQLIIKYTLTFCENSGVSRRVTNSAEHYARSIAGRAEVSGCSPRVLAASCVYLAALTVGEHISQQEIAVASDVSTPSIRKTYKRLITLLRLNRAEERN